jgi:hypothetical protein
LRARRKGECESAENPLRCRHSNACLGSQQCLYKRSPGGEGDREWEREFSREHTALFKAALCQSSYGPRRNEGQKNGPGQYPATHHFDLWHGKKIWHRLVNGCLVKFLFE